jgi:hypothetical protein
LEVDSKEQKSNDGNFFLNEEATIFYHLNQLAAHPNGPICLFEYYLSILILCVYLRGVLIFEEIKSKVNRQGGKEVGCSA